MSQTLPVTGVAILGIIGLILILLLLGLLFLWIRKRGQSSKNSVAASHIRRGDDIDDTDVSDRDGSDAQEDPAQGMTVKGIDE